MAISKPVHVSINRRLLQPGLLIQTMAVCLLLAAGCSSAQSGKPVRRGAKVNVSHFFQQPASYQGKIITLTLTVEEAIHRAEGQSLRQFTNRYVKFAAEGANRERYHLVIRLPEDIPIPDVAEGDEVVVTFLCSRGNPQQGNEAKAIEKR